MNIQEKFNRGAHNYTYTRVDPEYKVDIYIGYNNDGQMSMVIVEYGKPGIVKSSKLIDVKIEIRDDRKCALYFNLLDASYKSMYYIFCKDIISICEKSGSSMAISNAITRWKYWKEMFGKRKQSILDKTEIKGLIGELIELRDRFIKNFGETDAIASWMGPCLGHKDFEINDTWYEIKAVSENAIQVKISSLEQLESDIEGHLVVVRLEDTSTVVTNSITLNKVVTSIADLISDPDNLNLFMNKLDDIGYAYDEEYDSFCFEYKGTEYYSVKDKFPRLVRGEVNPAIGNASYTILLNAISDYREV